MKYDAFGFEREKIAKYLEDGFESYEEEIEYLHWLLHEYRTNPPELDPNVRNPITLEEYVKQQIDYKEKKIERLKNKKIKDERVNNKEEIKNIDTDYENLNNELKSAHTIIRKQKTRINELETGITKGELQKMVDEKCKFKNGKTNYSALGRLLICSNHTAKATCKKFNIL